MGKVMTLWPQILVAFFFVLVIVVAISQHGKPTAPQPTNAMKVIWTVFTFCAVLGAGGFWKL